MNKVLYETAHIALVVLFTAPAIVGILLCLPMLFICWLDDEFTSTWEDLP